MEFDRKDQHFAIKNEVESYVQQFMTTKMTRAKLSRELERLKDDLNNIIEVDGAYLFNKYLIFDF